MKQCFYMASIIFCLFICIPDFFKQEALSQTESELPPLPELPFFPEYSLKQIVQEMVDYAMLSDLEGINSLLQIIDTNKNYYDEKAYKILRLKLLIYSGKHVAADNLRKELLAEDPENLDIFWPISNPDSAICIGDIISILILQPNNDEYRILLLASYSESDINTFLNYYKSLPDETRKKCPDFIILLAQQLQGNMNYSYEYLKGKIAEYEVKKDKNSIVYIGYLEKEFSVCLYLHRYDESAKILDILKTNNPQEKWLYSLYEATSFIYQEKFDKAQSILNSIPEEKRNEPAYLLTTGLLNLRGGDIAKTNAICKELIKNPDYRFYARALRAEALWKTGKIKEAETSFRFLLVPNPCSSLSNIMLWDYANSKYKAISGNKNDIPKTLSEAPVTNWGVFPIKKSEHNLPCQFPKKDYVFD